jgi:aspartate 1-decarboxylase
MMRRLLRAAVRNATVTSGEGASLRIDPLVLRAANILPLEEVEIVHPVTGAHIVSFAEVAAEGSGEVVVPRLRAGDVVSLLSWGTMHDGQTIAHTARIVTLNDSNVVVSITEAGTQ